MSDLVSNIFRIKKSKPYIDYINYHKGNIFGLTKMSRRELMHSNFIAWALSPDASHALRFYPLQQLIKSLSIIQGNADNVDARQINEKLLYEFYNDNFIIDATIERESPVKLSGTTSKAKPKFIDILIKVHTKDKILPIIIENKVDSSENGPANDQTQIYFKWAELEFSGSEYYAPIYIYLYPEYNSSRQSEKAFIRMTYQELVDYVIEPSMVKCGDVVSKNNYSIYLQCLSFQTDNEKGEHTMAISNEEKAILKSFVEENRELLCAVLDELGELVDVDQASLSALSNGIKDTTKYLFEGSSYGKGRLVLAVVKQYVLDKKVNDFTELHKVFPDSLQGPTYGVVRLASSVSDADKGIGQDAHKRYFVKSNEIVDIPASGEKVLVAVDWGANNIDRFIQHAINLGYTITPV